MLALNPLSHTARASVSEILNHRDEKDRKQYNFSVEYVDPNMSL